MLFALYFPSSSLLLSRHPLSCVLSVEVSSTDILANPKALLWISASSWDFRRSGVLKNYASNGLLVFATSKTDYRRTRKDVNFQRLLNTPSAFSDLWRLPRRQGGETFLPTRINTSFSEGMHTFLRSENVLFLPKGEDLIIWTKNIFVK